MDSAREGRGVTVIPVAAPGVAHVVFPSSLAGRYHASLILIHRGDETAFAEVSFEVRPFHPPPGEQMAPSVKPALGEGFMVSVSTEALLDELQWGVDGPARFTTRRGVALSVDRSFPDTFSDCITRCASAPSCVAVAPLSSQGPSEGPDGLEGDAAGAGWVLLNLDGSAGVVADGELLAAPRGANARDTLPGAAVKVGLGARLLGEARVGCFPLDYVCMYASV